MQVVKALVISYLRFVLFEKNFHFDKIVFILTK